MATGAFVYYMANEYYAFLSRFVMYCGKTPFGHFGRYNEPAIRNGELCELTCPKRSLQPREACEQSPLKTVIEGDSVQTGSQDSFLRLFALSYGMTPFGHFGRYNEPAIRNGELGELTCPKSPLNYIRKKH